MSKLMVLNEQLEPVEFEEIEREHVHVQLDLFNNQEREIIGEEEWRLMMDEQAMAELMEEQAFLESQHQDYYNDLEDDLLTPEN